MLNPLNYSQNNWSYLEHSYSCYDDIMLVVHYNYRKVFLSGGKKSGSEFFKELQVCVQKTMHRRKSQTPAKDRELDTKFSSPTREAKDIYLKTNRSLGSIVPGSQ